MPVAVMVPVGGGISVLADIVAEKVIWAVTENAKRANRSATSTAFIVVVAVVVPPCASSVCCGEQK